MKRYTWRTGVIELVMIGAALLFAVPVYVLLNLSVRALGDRSSPLIPTVTPILDNFARAWEVGRLGTAFLNSVIVTVGSIAILIVVSSMAAYPLARVAQAWSRVTYVVVMFGLLLPFQLAFIPLYRTFFALDLLGSVWPLIIYYAGLLVPFSVFLYATFIRSLPREYEEAALIDGCSPFRSFFSVVFPLLRPVTGTVAAINAIVIWNDFLTPLLYLSGSRSQTLPVAIYSFVGQYQTEWPTVFAGLVISMAPVLLVFFAMQGQIMKGFSSGIKG